MLENIHAVGYLYVTGRCPVSPQSLSKSQRLLRPGEEHAQRGNGRWQGAWTRGNARRPGRNGTLRYVINATDGSNLWLMPYIQQNF